MDCVERILGGAFVSFDFAAHALAATFRTTSANTRRTSLRFTHHFQPHFQPNEEEAAADANNTPSTTTDVEKATKSGLAPYPCVPFADGGGN
jgi:hypothetical protein